MANLWGGLNAQTLRTEVRDQRANCCGERGIGIRPLDTVVVGGEGVGGSGWFCFWFVGWKWERFSFVVHRSTI